MSADLGARSRGEIIGPQEQARLVVLLEEALALLGRAGYHVVKPGQAVTADGVVCDIVNDYHSLIADYRHVVLRPVDGAS